MELKLVIQLAFLSWNIKVIEALLTAAAILQQTTFPQRTSYVPIRQKRDPVMSSLVSIQIDELYCATHHNYSMWFT